MKKIVVTSCAVLFVLVGSELSAASLNKTESQFFSGKVGKEMLEGAYISVGMGLSCSDGEVNHVASTYKSQVGMNVEYTDEDAAKQALKTAFTNLMKIDTSKIDVEWVPGVPGVQGGAAGTPAHITSAKITGLVGKNIASGKNNKFSGSLCFGYGEFVCHDIYMGMELGVDISGNNENSKKIDTASAGYIGFKKLQRGGVVPSLSGRMGFYITEADAMIYAKAGATLSKIEMIADKGNIEISSKVVPTVGLGIEKNMGIAAIRCEFDYRFNANKTSEFKCDATQVPLMNTANPPVANNVDFDHTAKIRVKNSGYTVRLLAVFHI